VAVRIAFNSDGERAAKPLPPPPRTEPSLLEALGVPVRAIPGQPDLMHHKYVVRDGAAVWTGSTNFEDLWSRGRVEGSGAFDTAPVDVGGVPVRAWFSPGAAPSFRTASPSASAWPGGACASPRPC
jgi:hypothetical protein